MRYYGAIIKQPNVQPKYILFIPDFDLVIPWDIKRINQSDAQNSFYVLEQIRNKKELVAQLKEKLPFRSPIAWVCSSARDYTLEHDIDDRNIINVIGVDIWQREL